ncbi:MAG TPA: hypothetical protein VMA32_15150 [Streptosporangiaceae bacterium]|nr:hypothetical protein [Streptosporangiaceae bacterium]
MPTSAPPRVTARPNGWPVRRMPRWTLAAVAAFLAAAVAVALVHKPTAAERASDMRGFLQQVTSDIESCAAGVGESLTALHAVQAEHYSNSSDISAGISVAQQGAANCAPANNEQIDDLENYQVPESLDSFGLVGAVSALVAWAAPNAEQVQADVARLLAASTPQARSQDEAALNDALRKLNAKRALVDHPVNGAIKTLALRSSPPRLPG